MVYGDAVITIGAGETITLHGVNAASLTAVDFVFNQTPVVANAGNMVVSDGAVLPLSGTIDNTGTIALNSSGDHTELQIIGAGVTLEGGGQLILSNNAANTIVGTGPSDTLTNVDNTISGAGQIGSGDGTLTLVNEAHGTIEANDTGGTLTLETGTTIINNGVLEALNGGTLQILDPVIGSGSAIIAGGTLIFDAPSNMNVTFNNGPNGTTYGELVLGDALGFSGKISGFTGTAPGAAHSDAIDLAEINYNSSAFSETYNVSTGLLRVTDGTHAASLTFVHFDGTFSFASDGHSGTLITDPPAMSSSRCRSPSAARATTISCSSPAEARHDRQLQSAARHDRARPLRQHSERAGIGGGDHPGRARQRGARARSRRQHRHSGREHDLPAAEHTKPRASARVVHLADDRANSEPCSMG